MPKLNKSQSKLDPIKVTLLPLANELLAFTKTMPPDLTKWTSGYFETLYKHLDIAYVGLWLDGGGFSDAARKFEAVLNQFLRKFSKWERGLRKAGVISTEQLGDLQNTNEYQFWELKEELDEIYDEAEKIAEWLKKLAVVVDKAGQNLMMATTAVKLFRVSIQTVRRLVKKGNLTDHRPEGSAKNAKLIIDCTELARLYHRRKQ